MADKMDGYKTKKNCWLFCIHLLIAIAICTSAKATVVIDSVKTTVSNCSNNGSITVFATTSSGSLFYAITAGPVTLPIQTSNIFSSLPPGNYTIEVSNTINERQTTAAIITGNYKLPEFFPIVTNPDCPSNSTGNIVGNATPTFGLAPFTWELAAGSPVVRPPQSSDTFNNLPVGIYTLRMTDACNNIQTKAVTLFTPPVTFTNLSANPRVTGCDTTDLSLGTIVSEFRPPYRVSYQFGGNTFVIDTAAITNQGALKISVPVPGLTYGGAVTNITVTDNCGNQVSIPQVDICRFDFFQLYKPFAAANCKTGLITDFRLGELFICSNTQVDFPFTITIRDSATNNLVETKTYLSYLDLENGAFISRAMEPGKAFNVTFTDKCNRTLTKRVRTPATSRYTIFGVNKWQTLLDSTMTASIIAYGFPTAGNTFTITGGPAFAQSTKPGYTYRENYVYPKNFRLSVFSDSSIGTDFSNTAPGTYYYSITDSCGNVYKDSFTVTVNDVADFKRSYSYKKGCAGETGLLFEYYHNGNHLFNVKNISANTVVYQAGPQFPFSNSGVVNNLQGVDYEMAIFYFGAGRANSINNILVDTFVVRDTIRIKPYQNPALQNNSAAFCNGNFILVLSPDSSRGIAPYRYEIIAGPQLFPIQTSNVFQMTQSGVYRVRLLDSCGNSTSVDVTVDSMVFPPMNRIGNTCIGGFAQLTYGASPYFSFTWTKPNGTQYSGDTLTIAPVTAADTGIYIIRRVTTINGCTSTSTGSYRLQKGATDSTFKTICSGQSFQFGGSLLTLPGIYRDTIVTANCDSISILNLAVLPLKRDSSARAICRGQSIVFGSSTLTQTGIYRDTIATATCDRISILNLTVNELKKDSSASAICRGQSILFGSRTLTQTGIYRDTIATASCDSISILNLTVNELPSFTVQASKSAVLKGETIQLTASPSGLGSYIWTALNTFNNGSVYNPTSVVNNPSWYKVIVTDINDCTNSDSVFVIVLADSIAQTCSNKPFYVPTAFTPNNDGRNDFFKVKGFDNIAFKDFRMFIYNRWGEKIFESSSPLQYWDGTYKGQQAIAGNYVYILNFICEEGRKIFRKGNIMLLR